MIHEDVLLEYASRVREGVAFPPVLVIFDGATHWLADGYHRWHAHKATGRTGIEAEVRQGSKRDAILCSLAANAAHGRQRGGADLRKAYGIAVRHRLVEAVDVVGVARLLACSERWARELTRDAREAADRERDADIVTERAAGASVREVAERHNVGLATVQRASVPERKSSVSEHPSPIRERGYKLVPVNPTVPSAWAQALHVLDLLTDAPPLEELFPLDLPHVRARAEAHIDHAVAWLGGLARRLGDA